MFRKKKQRYDILVAYFHLTPPANGLAAASGISKGGGETLGNQYFTVNHYPPTRSEVEAIRQHLREQQHAECIITNIMALTSENAPLCENTASHAGTERKD